MRWNRVGTNATVRLDLTRHGKKHDLFPRAYPTSVHSILETVKSRLHLEFCTKLRLPLESSTKTRLPLESNTKLRLLLDSRGRRSLVLDSRSGRGLVFDARVLSLVLSHAYL